MLTLFKRFPRPVWNGKQYPIVEPAIIDKYPELAGDFKILDDNLVKFFWQLDGDALRSQNQHRKWQVVLILGSAAAAILGAVQAAYPGSKLAVGIIEAVLAACLGGVIQIIRALKTNEAYYTNRLKAERLRSEYFLFLARAEPYGSDHDRVRNLVRRVGEIRQKREVGNEPAQ